MSTAERIQIQIDAVVNSFNKTYVERSRLVACLKSIGVDPNTDDKYHRFCGELNALSAEMKRLKGEKVKAESMI